MAFTPYKVIDLSAHQTPQGSGDPNASFATKDFTKLKEAGIKGVIFRVIGFRNGQVTPDASFNSGYTKAKAAGLYVGAYHYISQNFKTKQNGINDANLLLSYIRGKDLKMGVWCDVEDESIVGNKSGVTEALKGWCETISNAGFYAGIYANPDWFFNRMNINSLTAYAFWVARPLYGDGTSAQNNTLKADSDWSPKYNTKHSWAHKAFRSNTQLWQFTFGYRVPAFHNGNLDCSWLYANIPNAVTKLKKGNTTSGGTTAKAVSGFSPRKSAPDKSNKYYSTSGKNPLNPNYNGFNKGGNCTWYAAGRFSEIQGNWDNPVINPKCTHGRDAQLWKPGNRNSDGVLIINPNLTSGMTPKLGAVGVWAGTEYGHVAVVEEILPNGDIYVSESGYNHYLFRYTKLKASSGYAFSRSLTLQRFIYQPFEVGSAGGTKENEKPVSGNTRDNGSSIVQKKYLTWITEDSDLEQPLKLSASSMQNNGIITYLVLRMLGYNRDTICAILGNLEVQSHLNPATYRGWEETGDRDSTDTAYGLCQWSPPSVILDWIDDNEYSPIDGDAQLLWIDQLVFDDTHIYWKPNSDPDKALYYTDYSRFKTNQDGYSIDNLTRVFNYSFLNTGDASSMQSRIDKAYKWNSFINGNNISEEWAHIFKDFDGEIDDSSFYSPVYDGEPPESEPDVLHFVRGKKHLIFVEDNEPLLF